MAQRLLEERPDAALRVLVVWLPMWPGDAREAWDATLLADSRARHWWDGDLHAGRWLAANLPPEGYKGEVAWDAFYVFGRDARWDDAPGPVIASTYPVVRGRAALAAALDRAIQPGNPAAGGGV